uniref:Uncharacterized protein n=1 Tax=Tanacetum cinerariifolium TaxID=118510 RepID=A0A699GJK3_TANCI|nr:hypothetical protein [Tanacetum cinerariifolium]
MYPIDFVILDIKEDRRKPSILRTSFLTTARVEIKFDKGTITLQSGKSKVNFHKWLELFRKFEERKGDTIETLSIVNECLLEWKERIKLHHEKELELDQWRNKMFINKSFVSKDESGKSGSNKNQGGVTDVSLCRSLASPTCSLNLEGVELLESIFEIDDQEWVEMGSFLFVRLEMRSQGFKASIFLLIILLGTS